jgi:hypothetical protein
MEPVVELETAPMDVSMDIVEAEPDKRGAEDGGESQGDNEVGRRHYWGSDENCASDERK